MNEYKEIKSDENINIKAQWYMDIGLQEVDNLKTSTYLNNLLNDNINGFISIEEVKNNLRGYYVENEEAGTFN